MFDSDSSDNSIAGKLQFALVFVLGVYVLVPWMPDFIRTDDGDAAFTYSWHYLFANNDRFDSAQFLWPGPWAHAFYHAYHPGTYWSSLSVLAVLGISVSIVIARIAQCRVSIGWLRLAISIGLIALFSVSPDGTFMFIVLSPLLLLPDLRARSWRWWELGLIALVGLTFMIKFSFLLTAVAFLPFLLCWEIVYARQMPIGTILLVACVFLFAGLAAWTPGDYVEQIRRVFLSYGEFSEIAAEQGPLRELIAFVLLASFYMLVVGIVEAKRFGKWGILIWLTHAALIFLFYKQSFVRQDTQHVIRVYVAILAAGTTFILYRRDTVLSVLQSGALERVKPLLRRHGSLLKGVSLGGAAIMLFTVITLHPTLYEGKLRRLFVEHRAPKLENIVGMLRGGQEHLLREHERRKERIRDSSDLPVLEGTVTVLGKAMTTVLAHDFDVRLLPTVVPNVATDSTLVDANIEFLKARTRPDFALLDNNAKGRTVLALLEAYSPRLLTAKFSIFERSDLRRVELSRMSTTLARWTDIVNIPDAKGAPIWVTIEYQPSFLMRLAAFAYQPPLKVVETRTNGIWQPQFTLSRKRAADGFLLHPTPGKAWALTSLLATATGQSLFAKDRIDQLRFGISEGWLWKNEMMDQLIVAPLRISFYRVLLPSRKLSPTADMGQREKFNALYAAGLRIHGARGVPDIATNGEPYIPLRQRVPLEFDVPKGAVWLNFQFRHPHDSDLIEPRMLTFSNLPANSVTWSRAQKTNDEDKTHSGIGAQVRFTSPLRERHIIEIGLKENTQSFEEIFITGLEVHFE